MNELWWIMEKQKKFSDENQSFDWIKLIHWYRLVNNGWYRLDWLHDFFFFYTSNLQFNNTKIKKNPKIQVQNKTQTLRKSYTFLNRVCTRREHININDYNNYNNNNENKLKKKERKKKKRQRKKKRKKERIKTKNIYWGIKGFNEFMDSMTLIETFSIFQIADSQLNYFFI